VQKLGILYAHYGRLVEAENMYRPLQGYEKAFGAEHTSTLPTVNNLGVLYEDYGRLAEAQEMDQESLSRHEDIRDGSAPGRNPNRR